MRNNLELRYFCTGMSVSIRYSPTGRIEAQKFLHFSLKKMKAKLASLKFVPVEPPTPWLCGRVSGFPTSPPQIKRALFKNQFNHPIHHLKCTVHCL